MAATAGEAATAEAVGVATAAEAVAAAADDRAVGGSLVLGPGGVDRTGKGQADPPLRIRDNDARRPDAEQHGQAVLAVTPDPRIDDLLSLSWWYQAIVLADQGHEHGARGKNYEAPVRTPGSTSSNTWRWTDVITSSFDQYSEWFREPTLIRTVAQALQSKLVL